MPPPASPRAAASRTRARTSKRSSCPSPKRWPCSSAAKSPTPRRSCCCSTPRSGDCCRAFHALLSAPRRGGLAIIHQLPVRIVGLVRHRPGYRLPAFHALAHRVIGVGGAPVQHPPLAQGLGHLVTE